MGQRGYVGKNDITIWLGIVQIPAKEHQQMGFQWGC